MAPRDHPGWQPDTLRRHRQGLRFDVAARILLSHLLGREQRAATPGLRPLATRAGLLA